MRYSRLVTASRPVTPSAPARLLDVLREIARGGLAGLLAGVLVGGLGGRVAMSLAAILNPQATGLLTENGELIGAFTLNGTLALLVFGGIGAGLLAGVVWVVVAPWIPRGRGRIAAAGLAGIALGGFRLVEARNPDFIVLGRNEVVVVASLVALVGLVAAATAWFDARLERRLPRPQRFGSRSGVAYVLITIAGALTLEQVVRIYLDPSFSRHVPGATGWALLVVGIATLVGWVVRIRGGLADRPVALMAAGRIGLVAAALLGGQALWEEIADILDIG